MYVHIYDIKRFLDEIIKVMWLYKKLRVYLTALFSKIILKPSRVIYL